MFTGETGRIGSGVSEESVAFDPSAFSVFRYRVDRNLIRMLEIDEIEDVAIRA